ncbi:MAG: ABC transporter permease subunit [Elusimicrobia bacterium]|nr:ABC transporter permease subunit [Elusimicrobiota bacterium]
MRPPRRPSSAAGSWPALLSFLGVLALWELAARSQAVSPVFFPPPSAILGRMGGQGTLERVWLPCLATLGHALSGLAVGGSLGIATGVLCGACRPADAVLTPFINATYALPKIAAVPLVLALTGSGDLLVVSLVAAACAYGTAVMTRHGMDQLDPTLTLAAVNLGARRGQVLRHVVLPGLTPYLIAGLRLALLESFRMAVVIEALLAVRGLGRQMWISGSWFDMESYFAVIIVLAVLGYASVRGFDVAAAALAPWARRYELEDIR